MIDIERVCTAAEAVLRLPGHSVLSACPVTWSWLCELVRYVERYGADEDGRADVAARAAADPDWWASHVKTAIRVTASAGNLSVLRLMAIMGECRPWHLEDGDGSAQHPEARMRGMLRTLGAAFLTVLYGQNGQN